MNLTTDTLVTAIAAVLAAVIGSLLTVFFSRQPKATKPVILFDAFEFEANLHNVGLEFAEGKKPASKMLLKGFHLSNPSDEFITDVIVEYKNLSKPVESFNVKNDPSQGLLESYYDVAYSSERESLRFTFNTLPPQTSFKSVVTINDWFIPGGFHANSQQATIVSNDRFARNQADVTDARIQRLRLVFGLTVGAFTALVLVLIAQLS